MSSPSPFAHYSSRLGEIIRGFDHLPDAGRSCAKLTEKNFNSFALELFALQFAENLAYRRFCETRGFSPANVSSWKNIPAASTTAFKEADLSSVPERERRMVFYSSGTTEQTPSKHYHSIESLSLYEASLLSWFKVHALTPGEDEIRMLILTPSAAVAPHSSLVYMFETVRREFGTEESLFVGRLDENGNWTLDFEKTTCALETAVRVERPVLLLGTAFSFVHLLDHLGRNKLQYQLPKNSRVMETGGYKGKSRSLTKTDLYALVACYLGIFSSRIVCEYGMCELSSQAYDQTPAPAPDLAFSSSSQNDKRVFRFPPWSRSRIISPETGEEVAEGESGLIQVFDLANLASVLALQTEDLGVRRENGFELIGRPTLAEPRGCSLMNF